MKLWFFGKTRSNPKYLLDSLIYLAGSQTPYIHVILSYVVSITLYITQPLVRILLWFINPSVSMISFAQVWTAQWSNTIPCWNVQFQVGIHLTSFCFNIHLSLWSTNPAANITGFMFLKSAATSVTLTTTRFQLLSHLTKLQSPKTNTIWNLTLEGHLKWVSEWLWWTCVVNSQLIFMAPTHSSLLNVSCQPNCLTVDMPRMWLRSMEQVI